MLYNGIAQDAFKDDTAFGWQTDAAYKLNDAHTVRAGLYLQHDSSTVIRLRKCFRSMAPVVQTSDAGQDHRQRLAEPAIESVYLQDEWKACHR